MRHQKNGDLARAIEILGLSSPFSLLDIKRAYKERAMEFHPDRGIPGSEGEEGMKEINWAYRTLLERFEHLKISLDLLISSSRSDEEKIRNRFYYDWMPPDDKEVETA